MTCQGQPQLLHLSTPSCLPELWPWIWPVESVALLFSSGRHTPATAPAHHDARAQPCVDCAAPLGELSALFPSHLRQEPRCFSFEGASWRGAEFPHPFLCRACNRPGWRRPWLCGASSDLRFPQAGISKSIEHTAQMLRQVRLEL